MSRFDQRLEKLEQQTHGGSMRIVFVNYGETEEQAAARTGADPANVMFVSWVSPASLVPS